MNLLLFSAQDRLDGEGEGEGDRIRIAGQRLQHLQEVLSSNEGDRLRVGEINGLMGHGEILELGPDEALLQVELDQSPPPKLPLTLLLALPRPKMLRRILRTVAELGVAELHLLNSARVEKSYWQTPVLEPAVVEAYFLQGLSQSRDTVLPGLSVHKRFKPFVEDELPALIEGQRALLAHPGEYPPCPGNDQQATVLVIGPEGGFIPYEVEKLQAAGCDTISLGPRILRVENAVSTLIAKMST
ncbi:MAG: 16S rRNA (uracil(1498)-N(3))-methyltransferase [Halieaceae bacterium]